MSRRRRGAARRSEGGSILGNLLAALFGLILAVGLAEVAARVMFPRWDEFDSSRFITVAKVADWPDVPIGRPGFDGWFSQNNGDFRSHVRINSFGLRNDEPETAAAGRLWAVGDSFTFGWGVERDQIMGAVAGKVLDLPWYDVASPGTDLCGYRTLIARMPAEARPKAVLVGLTIENDVMDYDCMGRRTLAPVEAAGEGLRPPPLIWFKHGLTRISALYNFMAVSVKRVGSLQALLIELRLIDAPNHGKRMFEEGRMDAVLVSTADEVGRLRDMLAPATPLVVVIIPARQDLMEDDPFYRRQRQDMVRLLSERGIAAVDPMPLFRPHGVGAIHFAHDGHWSALGHRLAGEAAAARLVELGLGR